MEPGRFYLNGKYREIRQSGPAMGSDLRVLGYQVAVNGGLWITFLKKGSLVHLF